MSDHTTIAVSEDLRDRLLDERRDDEDSYNDTVRRLLGDDDTSPLDDRMREVAREEIRDHVVAEARL